jgi:hypothetical protein
MGRMNAYRVLVRRSEETRPLGKTRHRWEDNIKMDLRETGWGGMNWSHLAQVREQWCALVNMVMKFWVPENVEKLMSS